MTTLLQNDVESILTRFEQTWTYDIQDLNKPSTDQVLRDLICAHEPSRWERLEQEFFSAGPLAPLLADNSVSEIIVNGPKDIWFERAGEFHCHHDFFLSDLTYKNFIDRICTEAGAKIDLARPFTNGRWRNFRLHLGCSPLTHCSYHLSLRRMSANPWTLEMLVHEKWCAPEQAHVLRSHIKSYQNALIIGTTGSGKTSVLGACLKELRANERVVILEDTDELPLPNSASTKLLSRLELDETLPEIDLTDLVKQSLRMRPHRIVVGEVRGAEAKDLLLALATGHRGSFGTLHASDSHQALLRLEMLIQLGAPQWSLTAIRQLLFLSVNVIVVCGMQDGVRKLEGVFKVAALESVGLLLEQIA